MKPDYREDTDVLIADVLNAPRRPLLLAGAVFLLAMAMSPASSARGDTIGIASAIERGIVTVQEGVISWYGAAFHDRPTASGESFDSSALTMAHPTLPFGTEVRVTNLRNGRSIIVRVNDRGPFVGSRIADLSRAAAAQLGMIKRGVIRARIEVLGEPGAAADPVAQ